jgi:YfiH family protein
VIYPEIFDGLAMGFFTDREVGIEVASISGRPVYLPTQKHTDKIAVVEEDLAPREADAALSSRADIILGVQVADCVPILLLDRRQGVVGAVHAGWRGTAARILPKTIAALVHTYGTRSQDVLLALGPSIRGCCYEVGAEVLDAVQAATGGDGYHHRRWGKPHVDLQEANRLQATGAGISWTNISITTQCTCCHPRRYHSFRRDAGRQGRQGGFIGLP